ncbi:MAG: hypothetical protein ACKORF_03935 [Micrococcales bacterium]
MSKNQPAASNPIETPAVLNIRRAPKFFPFLVTGALVGFVVALVLNAASSSPVDPATGAPQPSILGYLLVFLGMTGAGLGIGTAVIMDRIFVARTKQVKATKLEG